MFLWDFRIFFKSVIYVEYYSLIIAEDFNIDNSEERSTIELLFSTFTNFGLTQHVKHRTHKQWIILDFIITKSLNISKVFVTDVALSEHFSICESRISNNHWKRHYRL